MQFSAPSWTVGALLAIAVGLVGLLVALEVIPVNALSVGGLAIGLAIAVILR